MRVNGKRVPDEWLQYEFGQLAEMRQRDPGMQMFDDQKLMEVAAGRVIDQVLLQQAAEKSKIKVAKKEVDDRLQAMIDKAGNEKRFLRQQNIKKAQLADYRKGIEAEIRRERFFADLVKDVKEPTEEDLFEDYKRDPMRFGEPEQLHVSHIVKHTNDGSDPEAARSTIEHAKRRLDAGEDFEKLCAEYSDCKGKSGDLGWFPRGQMVESFDQVVFKMKDGEISGVFETEFGFHIALVHERKLPKTKPFEEVKEDLAQEIFDRRRFEAVGACVEKLRASANIEP